MLPYSHSMRLGVFYKHQHTDMIKVALDNFVVGAERDKDVSLCRHVTFLTWRGLTWRDVI